MKTPSPIFCLAKPHTLVNRFSTR